MAGKFSELRKKAAEELGSRQSESYDTKDSSGKFQGFLKTDKEIKTWKCAEGDHLIDVIPYLAGNRNPNPKIKKDSISYVLTINTHDNIGAAGASVICPLTNYGKPCPVCEEQKRLKDEGLEWDDPLVKALNHKKKTLYNVVVYDTAKEEEKGVQLWITSHWNFERHLVEIARSGRRGGSNVTFADPDTGRSVAFRREGKKATDTKYVGHRFEDRGYIIPDDILDAAYCLEDLVVVLSYDEIAAILGGGSRQESNDAPAERRQRGQRTPEPMPEPEEVPATRMSRNRPEPTPEPEPEQTSGLSRRQKPAPEPDPEEAPADDNCFGVGFEKSDLCQECEEYDNCGAEHAQQEKKTSQTPSERLRRPGRR